MDKSYNWEIKHSESKDAFNIVNKNLGDKYKIARIPYMVTETTPDVSERNKKEALAHAKLIVSAPKLLDLAKKYLAYVKNRPLEYEEDFEYRDYIEGVIKEATE